MAVISFCAMTSLVLDLYVSSKTPDTEHRKTKSGFLAGNWDVPPQVAGVLRRKAALTNVGNEQLGGVVVCYAESRTGNAAHVSSAQKEVIFWTKRMSSQIKCGHSSHALKIFEELQERGLVLSSYTFVAALKACCKLKDLKRAKQIHAQLVDNKLETDVHVGTMLVDVYVKCGSLQDATHVFFNMPCRDVVSWTAMILGHAQMGSSNLALELFEKMQQEGILPNDRTYVSALKACSSSAALEETKEVDGNLVKQKCLEKAREIHLQIRNAGYEKDVYVATMLVDVYVKCGSILDARQVFEMMPCRDVISWTSMIIGYVHLGEGELALQLYARMRQEGIVPDCRVIVGGLQACSILAAREVETMVQSISIKRQRLSHIKAIHSDALKWACESDVCVGGLLVDGYVKCGSLSDARLVFDRVNRHDLNAWNAMIWGYAQIGEGKVALEFYSRMQHEGVAPSDRTFLGALKALTILAEMEKGDEVDWSGAKRLYLQHVRAIHMYAVQSGYGSDIFVATMLVDVYAKCGSLSDARRVFDGMPVRDVVSWNAMIFGYTQVEAGEEALNLFAKMQQEGVVPDDRSFVSALKACSSLVASEDGHKEGNRVKKRCLDQVKAIHSHVIHNRSELDVFVATMLVDSYAKCGSLVDAKLVFDNMPHRDVVCWTAMIMAFALSGEGEVALQLYRTMEKEGIRPNNRTYVGALKACGSVAGLEMGKEIHSEICRYGLQASDLFVASSLIDMYVDCGSMVDAQKVFDALLTKNVVTWNALISGYARHGGTAVVLDLFDSMDREGVQPVAITFLSLLTACSHAGSLDRAQFYFASMKTDFGITPGAQHKACMIDLLGRAGQVDEAIAMARTCPSDLVVWKTVLSACQKWGRVDLGRVAFECAVTLDQDDTAAYLLMWNIYIAARMYSEADMIQAMKAKIKGRKQHGQSWWTDSAGTVHSFMVSDRAHSESSRVFAQLENLIVSFQEEKFWTPC